jgi:hypothetical protein
LGIFQKYFRIFRGFFPSPRDDIPRFHLQPQVAQIVKTEPDSENADAFFSSSWSDDQSDKKAYHLPVHSFREIFLRKFFPP